MAILDLVCKNSVSFSTDCYNTKTDNKRLYVGGAYNYISFLYFPIPPYLYNKELVSAKLILFKHPLSKHKVIGSKRCYSEYCYYYKEHDCIKEYDCNNDKSNKYILCPLLEYFSVYSDSYSVPKADLSKKISFVNDVTLCYTEIDITKIMESWLNEDIDNKGVMLFGNDFSNLISYGSENDDVAGMHPVIRLAYKEKPCPEVLSSIPCIVEVK